VVEVFGYGQAVPENFNPVMGQVHLFGYHAQGMPASQDLYVKVETVGIQLM
jgi:hypothetical protein